MNYPVIIIGAGGQRQRIGIARELYKQASVLSIEEIAAEASQPNKKLT